MRKGVVVVERMYITAIQDIPLVSGGIVKKETGNQRDNCREREYGFAITSHAFAEATEARLDAREVGGWQCEYCYQAWLFKL